MIKLIKIKPLLDNQSLHGIFLLIAGGLIFSIQDVIIKFISGSYPVHEIVFMRSLFAILPVFAIIRIEGGLYQLRTKSIAFHFVRGILMFLCYTSYYLSIAVIPLSHTVTLFFCCPLLITVLSVLFLEEKIDIKGWLAIITGFCGIIVVMRPDMAISYAGQTATNLNGYTLNFSANSLLTSGYALALLSGLFYAITAVCTRKYARNESGSSLVFYPIITYLLFSGIVWFAIGDGRFINDGNKSMAFLLRSWTVPENRDLLLLIIIGCVAAGGTYCLSLAYKISKASIVAPFEYFVIPISIIWSYLFWKELPDPIQLIGIIIIITSGVYVLRRSS